MAIQRLKVAVSRVSFPLIWMGVEVPPSRIKSDVPERHTGPFKSFSSAMAKETALVRENPAPINWTSRLLSVGTDGC